MKTIEVTITREKTNIFSISMEGIEYGGPDKAAISVGETLTLSIPLSSDLVELIDKAEHSVTIPPLKRIERNVCHHRCPLYQKMARGEPPLCLGGFSTIDEGLMIPGPRCPRYEDANVTEN